MRGVKPHRFEGIRADKLGGQVGHMRGRHAARTHFEKVDQQAFSSQDNRGLGTSKPRADDRNLRLRGHGQGPEALTGGAVSRALPRQCHFGFAGRATQEYPLLPGFLLHHDRGSRTPRIWCRSAGPRWQRCISDRRCIHRRFYRAGSFAPRSSHRIRDADSARPSKGIWCFCTPESVNSRGISCR